MNREIKFRGYSEELKSFVYGFYQEVEVEGIVYSYIFWQGNTTLVISDSVAKFTGILDVNKKPIYDGDIVNDDELGKGIVVFQSGCFFIMYDAETNMEFLGLKIDRFGRLQEKRVVEILGNIYENSELSEEQLNTDRHNSVDIYDHTGTQIIGKKYINNTYETIRH